MKRTGPPKRRTPLSPVSKDPGRRRRTQAARQRQHGGDYGHYIRSHLCLCWPTGECSTKIDCARVETRGAHPELNAPGHTVPLCRRHHIQQGSLGILTFQRRYRLDLEQIAARLKTEWEADHAG